MEALRWILLLIGVLLVGAIYWFGRRQDTDGPSEGLVERARRAVAREARARPSGEAPPDRREPDLDIDDLEAHGFEVDARPGEGDWTRPDAPGPIEEAPARPPGSAAEVESGPDPEPEPEAAPESETEPDREPEPGREPAERADAPSAGPATEEPAAGESAHFTPPAPPADEPEPEPAQAAKRASKAPPAADDRSPSAEGTEPRDERVVVLYLVALSGERLVGSRLRAALERNGLRHGAYGIFHAGDSEGGTAFSVANVVEPGTFDRATMDTLTTPGVALFMQVPGAQAAETIFDRMLSTARSMADELDARVLDERHSTLTRQTEQHLREELRLLDRRTRSGQR